MGILMIVPDPMTSSPGVSEIKHKDCESELIGTTSLVP